MLAVIECPFACSGGGRVSFSCTMKRRNQHSMRMGWNYEHTSLLNTSRCLNSWVYSSDFLIIASITRTSGFWDGVLLLMQISLCQNILSSNALFLLPTPSTGRPLMGNSNDPIVRRFSPLQAKKDILTGLLSVLMRLMPAMSHSQMQLLLKMIVSLVSEGVPSTSKSTVLSAAFIIIWSLSPVGSHP